MAKAAEQDEPPDLVVEVTMGPWGRFDLGVTGAPGGMGAASHSANPADAAMRPSTSVDHPVYQRPGIPPTTLCPLTRERG